MDADSLNANPLPSIWQLKPWWCQPWSILLTGIMIIGSSWFFFHTLWLTLLVAVPILIWMGFFLLIYPKAMQQLLQQENAQNSLAPDRSNLDRPKLDRLD